MTQSGQGDERQLPAVRPAHEGVVLPAEGGAPWNPGGPASGQPDQAAPAGGQPWGGPWGPQAGQQGGLPPGQLPPEQHQQGAYQPPQHGQYQQPGQQHYAPQQDSYQQDPYQQDQYHQPQPYAQPLPPEAGPSGAMGQGGDADATQYIAPVPGGALPGGMPPEHPAESTQYLGHNAAPAQQSDADATQYIPPVPGGAPYGIRPGAPGDRQPPAEFDSLFRSDEPAGATQQMPRFAGQQQPQQGGHQQQPQGAPPYRSGPQGVQDGNGGHGGYGAQEPDRGGDAPRRRSAAVPLIAAVVIGCAVIGLGAGALMSGGDDSPSDDKKTVAAQSPTADSPSEEAADPAKPQAEELDKLLADSNNSRSAVISAVEKIKSCRALDEAATDLQGAAEQRRGLVTRLEALSVDQLPAHAELKTSLTDAWQASAEADDHYAAWAVQAKDGKKVCKGGKARSTDETAKANASSGEATTAKRKASGLWNSIAQKYGLTERAPTQL
ncbi:MULTISPECIES: hypothetical protein [unclassified Streptomyces]|uniref:hypothetical protein n=1 Tax=unclassified Streptomyces TaxID=2593676 RepID=UPI002E103343|nr:MULTISPECIES: hypothetical protein [unclassified Streptomyces]WSQ85604.1 hypothetical protein OG722_15095 [Streptomyces sp. NBC_01212]WSR08305.1 hypothetical protein OG265_20920 [Streptomyces sp. NBC_01208]